MRLHAYGTVVGAFNPELTPIRRDPFAVRAPAQQLGASPGVGEAPIILVILPHLPFGFLALLGVTALMGMIMRNSVILIDQIEQDLERGMLA